MEHTTPTRKDPQELSWAQRAGELLKERGVKLTAAATAGVLTLSLVGCGAVAKEAGPTPETTNSANENPSSTPSAGETESGSGSGSSAGETTSPSPSETTPSASPSPEQEPGNSYEFDIDEKDVEALLALDDSEFLRLDITERVKVPLYFAQKMDIQAMTKLYASITGYNDKLPEELSVDNKGQQILAWDAAMTRLGFWVPSEDDPRHIDPNIVRKIAGGTVIDGAASKGYHGTIEVLDQILAIDGGIVGDPEVWGVSKISTTYRADGETEVSEGPNGRPTKTISYTNPETSVKNEVTFEWVTVGTNDSGDELGVWVQR